MPLRPAHAGASEGEGTCEHPDRSVPDDDDEKYASTARKAHECGKGTGTTVFASASADVILGCTDGSTTSRWMSLSTSGLASRYGTGCGAIGTQGTSAAVSPPDAGAPGLLEWPRNAMTITRPVAMTIAASSADASRRGRRLHAGTIASSPWPGSSGALTQAPYQRLCGPGQSRCAGDCDRHRRERLGEAAVDERPLERGRPQRNRGGDDQLHLKCC